MSIHALDAVLVELAAASTALERTAKPSLKDVKEAKASAKKAVDLLGAAETFMGYGIYTVTDEPVDSKFVDPNSYRIEMPEAASDDPIEPKPLPEILALFDSWGEEEQLHELEMRLDALADKVLEFNENAETDYEPWNEAMDRDRKDTFLRLVIAEERETACFIMPTDEERDAWLKDHGQLQTDQASAEASEESSPQSSINAPEDDISADELFQQKLDELEEAGVKESGLKRKAWKKTAEPAWRQSYQMAPPWTLEALLWRLQQPSITWDVPTPEEMTPELDHAVGEE